MTSDSASGQARVVAIQVEDLHKTFGDVRALGGASSTVYQGQLFGYLGPNGAGKTTTISLLTGLARSDSGSICIAGIDCGASPEGAQHLVGVVPDESNLYPELTGFENPCFCAVLYGVKKAEREAQAKALLESFRPCGGSAPQVRRLLQGDEAQADPCRCPHSLTTSAFPGRAHYRDRPRQRQADQAVDCQSS